MLCSISTSSKSGSNWLDRLRSSKGFPAADQLDLDQFLSHNPHNLCNSTDATLPESTATQIDPNSSSNSAQESHKTPTLLDCNQTTDTTDGEREWFGVMSNVLSELFYMGETDTNHFSKTKSCRKQPNPKIFHLSTSQSVNDALPSTSQRAMDRKEMSNQLQLREIEGVNVGPVDVEEEEEERGNADLSSFSRTEVTVIDTSYPSWKFEKMLFRRKNVWKVRDRKCKSIIPNRRKRKANLSGNAAEDKKQCSSYKVTNGEEGLAPTHEVKALNF